MAVDAYFFASGRLLDVPFKLEVGILLGVGAYSEVGSDSVLYGILKSICVTLHIKEIGAVFS